MTWTLKALDEGLREAQRISPPSLLDRFEHWIGSLLPEPRWYSEPLESSGPWRVWNHCAAYRGKWGRWAVVCMTGSMSRKQIVAAVEIVRIYGELREVTK